MKKSENLPTEDQKKLCIYEVEEIVKKRLIKTVTIFAPVVLFLVGGSSFLYLKSAIDKSVEKVIGTPEKPTPFMTKLSKESLQKFLLEDDVTLKIERRVSDLAETSINKKLMTIDFVNGKDTTNNIIDIIDSIAELPKDTAIYLLGYMMRGETDSDILDSIEKRIKDISGEKRRR